MKTLTIAVAQAPPVAGNPAANAETACALLEQAAAQGARLTVFPELFLCGYDLEGIAADPDGYAVRLESEPLARIARACRDTESAAIVGACLSEEAGPAGGDMSSGSGILTNAAVIIDAGGEVRAVYRKVQLWQGERTVFEPGDQYVLVDLFGFRVGVMICYDGGFPEHARALTLAGAEIIACPAAFAVGDEQRRYRLYFPQRALENTVYLAVSNAVGVQGGLAMFGESAIFDPAGRPLVSLGGGQGVGVAVVDRSVIAGVRRDLPYLAERRADLPPPQPDAAR
ncbi:MAG TPA: carbon-nitrogen hydrolase family protein [Limnochordales bacterium]